MRSLIASCCSFRHQTPVTADHALDQPLMPEVIEAALPPIPLAPGIDQGEVVRLTGGLDVLVLAAEEQLLQRHRNTLGEANTDEAAGRHCIAVADQPHRRGSRDDLALTGGPQEGKDRMRRSRVARL